MNNDIAYKYHNTYHETSIENTIAFFNKYEKNVLSSINNNMNVIFVRLSDDTFDLIKENTFLLADINFMRKCFLENGKNVHLIKAFGNGFKEFRQIINNIIEIYHPKTLTWFRDDLKLHSIKVGGY